MSVPSLAADTQPPSTTNVSGEPIQLSTTELSKIEVIGTAGQYEIDAVQSPESTQPLRDIPQTVNVISGELIREQGAATLTEALRNSPGVGTSYVSENGKTSTGDAVYMRGFDASGSIFVDGVRDSGSIARDTFDTAQVQVINGPDGTVFGRTTPTGAINMVSNLVVQNSVDMQFHHIGRERVKGVELGAVGQVTQRWALSAGYTVNV